MRKGGGGGAEAGGGRGGRDYGQVQPPPRPAGGSSCLVTTPQVAQLVCLFFLRKTKFKISDNFFFEILTAELKESCQLASLWTGFCGSVFLSSNLVLTPARVCPGEG